MDLPEYRHLLGQLRAKHTSPSFRFRTPHLRPKYDSVHELIGWKLAWVGAFTDQHFLRLKEDWSLGNAQFARGFFSYHYGPYEANWVLETVRATKVTARIDAQNYDSRGYHIHDGEKDKRIHQDQLIAPDLANFTMDHFIECVMRVRQGQAVGAAFDLVFN